MGLPQIDINFTSLAVSAIQRSQRGIVALILRDDTAATLLHEYKSITEVSTNDWTEENLKYIKGAFLGIPSKVIVARGTTTDENYNLQLESLESRKWNWLAVPGIETGDTTVISTWIITQRENGKTFKAVLPNRSADHEAIVNFTTSGIKVGEKSYDSSQYTARIAGLLAGLSLDRSATYYELTEVEDITEHQEPDEAINEGQLVLIKSNDKIKIGRAVNSLTSTTSTKSSLFKKIKIVEGMDLIKEDIASTFNDEYVGRVINNYDNQVLFITAVNAYLKGLAGTVLDGAYDNRVNVDVEAQRAAWEEIGTDTSDWDDDKVREMSFQSNVYLNGSFKFLDAMEDLTMEITLI